VRVWLVSVMSPCTSEFYKRVILLILMSGIMDEQSLIVTRRKM
jgi:hypothetical protein